MRRRIDARNMAAVLDKAREISRSEPTTDWSEAEWKKLMAAAASQELEQKTEGRGSIWKPALWKPLLGYGTLALIMVAIIGLALKNTVFRPAASPVSQAPVLAQKSVPPPPTVVETPPTELPAVIARASRAPQAAIPKPTRPTIRPGGPAAAPREEGSQDVVSVKLVSPDTGLQIVWFLDKNFKWKGETP